MRGLQPEQLHQSVLLDEAVSYLDPKPDGIYVDGTMGLGGHSQAILERTTPSGQVIGFEWDETAIEQATVRLRPYASRYRVVRKSFSELLAGLASQGVEEVDGILIDVGLSSLQLDHGKRGFSFRFDEPLDMRMDSRQKMTAAEIVNTCEEQELADIFYYYGEERQARVMAAAIVEERKKRRITTTLELVEVIEAAVPKRFHPKRIHVATKVFQALRIAVNGELENLSAILEDGPGVLKRGGRFCVISFHSLEDRMVKRKFKENGQLGVVTGKPVTASKEELEKNPRARSAKMRVAEKL